MRISRGNIWEIGFLVFMGLGIAPLLYYETIQNQAHYWAFKNLTFPTFIVGLIVSLYKIKNIKETVEKLKVFAFMVLFCSIVLLMSAGYVMWVNALIGQQEEYPIEGEVLKLDTYTNTKNVTSYTVSIKGPSSGETIKLDVSKSHYETLQVGSHFKETWKIGSLGLVYKYK